jgi:hypothetical protein
LFDAEDPFADRRALDDRQYALDHFQCKLLRLPETMQTTRGKEMAQHNARFLVEFMAKLSAELQGSRWRWMKRFYAALHRRRQPTGDLWYSLQKSSALVEDMPQKLIKENRSLPLAEQAGEEAQALLRQLMTIYDVKTLVAELVSVGEQHWSAAILKRVAALPRGGAFASAGDRPSGDAAAGAASSSPALCVPLCRFVCRYRRDPQRF